MGQEENCSPSTCGIKLDLSQMENNIKAHIDSNLAPIKKYMDEKDLILLGPDRRSGLIGEVNDIKSGIKVFKWIAGSGGGAGVAALLHRIFSGH
jgi:hypothetical protein